MQDVLLLSICISAASAIAFLLGWLIRQSSLARAQLARKAIFERDLEYARCDARKNSAQVGLLEADLKKAAFDAGQSAEKISVLQLEKSGLSDALHHAAVREAKMLADRSDLMAKTTAFEEQVLGLRTKTANLMAENVHLQDHEEAQKRLRADCGAALHQLHATRSELLESEQARLILTDENAELRTKIERLKTRPILLPTILPTLLNGSKESENGQNGYKNGQTGHKNGSKNGKINGEPPSKNNKKAARKSLISMETAAALDPIFFEKELKNGFEKVVKNAAGEDLKIINGIGPKEEKALFGLGILTVEKLAELTTNDLAELAEGSENLMKKLRKEGWQSQAQHLIGVFA